MAATLVLLAIVTVTSASGQAHAAEIARVRLLDRGVERLYEDALDRSPTLRRLVRTLEQSDVIVYVELRPWLPRSLPAGLTFAGAGGGFRYLRIVLNPSNTRRQMLDMLGHELQHAVEIARAPSVRSRETLAAHFAQIGRRAADGWETDAARDTGRAVGREATSGIALATSLAKRSSHERE